MSLKKELMDAGFTRKAVQAIETVSMGNNLELIKTKYMGTYRVAEFVKETNRIMLYADELEILSRAKLSIIFEPATPTQKPTVQFYE